ncbi:MAG: hypothetical protein Kow0099_29180 [Candidatus Abyssubacteria bacterium]
MRHTVALLSCVFLFVSLSRLALADEYHMLDTEEALTIGQGNFQTEMEIGVTKQPDASELYNIPRIRLTYGLSEWADIEFDYEVLAVDDTDFVDFDAGITRRDHDDFGTGDLRIKLKMVPYEFGPHRLGLQFITKLPNAEQDEGLGTNEIDATSLILFSSDWGRFKTHLNLGFIALGDPKQNGNQNDFVLWGIGGEYALTEALTLMGEVEGSTSGDSTTNGFTENIAEGTEGNARARVRLALTGPIGNWRWGISGFKGVNSHTEDWGVQTGLSRVWGVGGPTEPATPPAHEREQPESYFNPLKTEEAYTIGERNFRMEAGFGYVNQPDDSDLFVVPDVVFGWGIGPWADFEIELQYLAVQDTTQTVTGGRVRKTDVSGHGIGDLRAKFKASPFEFTHGRLGISFVTKGPSAEDHDALGTDEADFSAKILFSTDWSQFFGDAALGRLKTHLNAGIAIQGDPEELSRQDDFLVWGIAAEYELMPKLILWSELEGSTNGKESENVNQGDYGNAYAEARIGLTGPLPGNFILQDWRWAIAASTGLNNHSRDWTANVGLSHTWGL